MREEDLTQVRETTTVGDHLGFTAAIGARSISEEVARFSPLWFPRGKL